MPEILGGVMPPVFIWQALLDSAALLNPALALSLMFHYFGLLLHLKSVFLHLIKKLIGLPI